MSLDHGYGVAIGNIHRFYRDDPDSYGKYYHGIIDLNVNGSVYTCAIDVDTKSNQVSVEHRIVEIAYKEIEPVLGKGNGYHSLISDSNSGAIDYIRSPMLMPEKKLGCLPGIIKSVLPFEINVRGNNSESLWIKGNSQETLNSLESLIEEGENQKVLIFGEPFHDGTNGVHNIHQNQGDPTNSRWSKENGIWQDGCTIFVKKNNVAYAFLNKFSTQSYYTNDMGKPTPATFS